MEKNNKSNKEEKYKIEDVLDRVVQLDCSKLEGHSEVLFKSLLSFVMSCRGGYRGKPTTKVLTAWDEITVRDKAILTEHFSKYQLVEIGLAVAMTEPLRRSVGFSPMGDSFKDMIEEFRRFLDEDEK